MAIVEDEALVLRSIRHGETSRIATLLGRRYGKVHVIAKGARDVRSPFGSALEPPALVQLVFYLKKQRSLQFLRAAATEQAFPVILAHTRAYHLACAGLEFVDRVVTDEDPVPEVFAALLRFLQGCERRPDHPRGEFRLRTFQLHTVSLLGYAPQLDRCAACGRAGEAPAGFGVTEGGVLCRTCAASARPMPLSPAGLEWLRQVVTGATARPGTTAGPGASLLAAARAGGSVAPPAAQDSREVIAVVEAFLQYHVTGYRGLRALRCLEAWAELTKSLSRRG